MKRQFAKNLGSNWVVYITAALLSFFMMPYILSKIGQAALGVWILVGSFSGYLGLFDFGIGFAVVRYVARYQKTGETGKRNETVATAFYLAALMSVLVIAATILIMVYAGSLFDIPPELVASSRAVIFLIGISIAIGFPLSIFNEALAGGLWRYDLSNLVAFFTALLRVGLTILFLELDFGLAGLGVAALVGSLAGYLWRAKMLFGLLPDLSLSPALVKKPVIKRISGYSFYSFILVLSGRIAFYSDSFIVGIFRGVEDVAIFGIAAKLTEYLRQLIFTMTRLFSPVASRYDPDTDRASLKRIFYDGSRLHLLFSLPLSLVLFFWGGQLISIWMGDRFSASQAILQVLLIGHILSFLQGIGGEILLGVGRHRFFSLLSLLAAAVNIALSIILIERLGLVGVAWGTTFPLAAMSIFYLPLATLRLVGGNPVDFLKKAIFPALGASFLPAIIVIYAASRIKSIPDMILWGLAGTAVYCLAAYNIGLRGVEKEKIKNEWKRRFSGF